MKKKARKKIPATKLPTPERILRAASECLLNLGYPRTTVKEIAARADVPQGLIHHHFGSKENLFCSVIDDLNREIAERNHPPKPRDPEEFKRLQRHFRLFVEFVAMAPHMPEVARALKVFIQKRKDQVKERMEIEEDGQAFFLMSFLVGMSVLSLGYPGLPVQKIQKHLQEHFPDFF